MKLKDKKLIAEWMGWKIFDNGYQDDPNITDDFNVKWEMWNPDTDHKNFFDVWFKLSFSQQVIIGNGLHSEARKYPCVLISEIGRDLPKVMDKILLLLKIEGCIKPEVIKGE